MRRVGLMVAAIVVWTSFNSVAVGGDIAVVNPGFEEPDLGGIEDQTWNWNDWDGSGVKVITGWSYDFNATAWPSANDTGVWNGVRDGVPAFEELNMAFVRHSDDQAAEQTSGLWQDLGYPIAAGETYTFSMAIQRRQDATAASLTFNYDDAGTRTQIVQNLIDMETQENNSWQTYSVSFTAADGEAYIGKSMGIEFNNESATDAWSHFDAVTVSFDTGDILLGDVNQDGEVNGLDVDPFVDVLLNGPYQAEADMNEDTVVNGLDVDPFVAAVVGGGVQAVPEPSSLALLTLAGLAIVFALGRRTRNV